MPNFSIARMTYLLRAACRLSLLFSLLASLALSQTPHALSSPVPTAQGGVTEALDHLDKGEEGVAEVALLARARAMEAIPNLEKQFPLTKDTILKTRIASALVKLGQKDSIYWDYLLQGAAEAITTDAPSQTKLDSKGKLGPSPEFVAWAKSHGLSTDAALQQAMFESPAAVLFLAESEDRRAIPLLRRALFSQNFMVQGTAAQGLAELQDKASIPMMIEACRQSPAGAAAVIAGSLLDFNDPQAQAAAKEFRPEAKPK